MIAVILAGGFGTRLKNKTKNIPKPMLKIGGFPILEHQINLLKRYGIKEIIILTHYLSEVIENYFKNGGKFGVKISYFKENEPLGTAGGLQEIKSKLKDDFLVIYGDKMLDMDLKTLIDFHRKNNGIAALVLHPTSHPYDSDLVEIDGNKKIIAFHPKPHPKNKYFKNLVNAAVYMMSPNIIKYIKHGVRADFGKDIFPVIAKKESLYGYETAEYIRDVGTQERLIEVNKDYGSGKIERLNKNNTRKAIFMDRDGVINHHIDLLGRTKDFRLFETSAKAIKKINNSEFLAIVITNQPGIARKDFSMKNLEEIHKKMETLLGKEGAKLDAVYLCPHHPDYDIKCNCRKPETGLVKMAEKDFNIDIKKSFFIGDSWRDIMCGRNSGAITIGVKTGKGCRDIDIKPDYFSKNLYEAVNFIIKHDSK